MILKHILFSQKGMSLLEVLLASVIFSVGLLGVMGMYSHGETGMDWSRNLTAAVVGAREKMEEKWGVPWEKILRDDLDEDGTLETLMKQTGSGIYAGKDQYQNKIKREWTIITNQDPPGLIQVRVTTTWKDRNGKERSFSLMGLRTR